MKEAWIKVSSLNRVLSEVLKDLQIATELMEQRSPFSEETNRLSAKCEIMQDLLTWLSSELAINLDFSFHPDIIDETEGDNES